jgi:uncharacterized protein
MFDSPVNLILGLLTGVLFGILLQKGRVAKFEVIVGQFLLRDWTVVKMMGTAVVVGAIGVYALVANDLASLHIRPAVFGGVLVGGFSFGIGMAVFGYCPGTSVAACGEGRRDAMLGVLGMFCGAILYVTFFDQLEPMIQSLGNWGKVTLPDLTNTSPWVWIALLTAGGVIAFFFFDFAKRSHHRVNQTSP